MQERPHLTVLYTKGCVPIVSWRQRVDPEQKSPPISPVESGLLELLEDNFVFISP
jgi:hypothetical protein